MVHWNLREKRRKIQVTRARVSAARRCAALRSRVGNNLARGALSADPPGTRLVEAVDARVRRRKEGRVGLRAQRRRRSSSSGPDRVGSVLPQATRKAGAAGGKEIHSKAVQRVKSLLGGEGMISSAHAPAAAARGRSPRRAAATARARAAHRAAAREPAHPECTHPATQPPTHGNQLQKHPQKPNR